MKMAPIPPLRSRFVALAPANLRDTLNRHSRAVNTIALAVILLVLADLAGWTAPLERMFQHNPLLRSAIMRSKINGFCVLTAASFWWLQ